LTPDATVADTGVAAGEYNGRSYWRWLVGEQEWFLFYRFQAPFHTWRIADHLESFDTAWIRLVDDPVGTYAPSAGEAVGNPTVAEYEEHLPPTGDTLVIRWKVSGEITILRKKE
jgi:hypothetical protein